MNTDKSNFDRVNKIVIEGVEFRATGYRGGSSVNTEEAYARKVANICRGIQDLRDISKLILKRLKIEYNEQKNQGVDQPNFLCAAYLDILEDSLRGCCGVDQKRTQAPTA